MNKSYTVIYSKKSKKFIEKHRKEGVIFYKIFEELLQKLDESVSVSVTYSNGLNYGLDITGEEMIFYVK